jgi:hypothetical protein
MEHTLRDDVAFWSTKSIALLAAIGLVGSMLLGFWVGNSSPYGSKHLDVKAGRAMLHNTQNWFTSFDTDDPSEQLAFFADAVASDSATGFQDHGVPPCLKVGEMVRVRVGYASIHFPSGVTAPVVQWVECMDG